MEFTHIDIEKYDKNELEIFRCPYFEAKGYLLRVFRRGNLKDYKDYISDGFTVFAIQDFVITSSFVGPEQLIVKELNLENANKIFSYNKPVLIMFRDASNEDYKDYDHELSHALEKI